MYKLTETGKIAINNYIIEAKAKRKEILDAGLDTADETSIPTEEDILADIEFQGIDDEGEYYNCWGVTDNYNTDYGIFLTYGIDFIDN